MTKRNITTISKLVILLISTSLFIAGCTSSQHRESVQVKISPNPAKPGQVAIVRISVDHLESWIPDFYIINKNDTSFIEYIHEEKCGKFELLYSNPGIYEFEGYVDYIDKHSVSRIEHYEIIFNVEE